MLVVATEDLVVDAVAELVAELVGAADDGGLRLTDAEREELLRVRRRIGEGRRDDHRIALPDRNARVAEVLGDLDLEIGLEDSPSREIALDLGIERREITDVFL